MTWAEDGSRAALDARAEGGLVRQSRAALEAGAALDAWVDGGAS